jgi:hypothetical protein
MRNPNVVEPTISAVPVSLYRELCSELQEKNGEVNALTLKNQRILDENQQLRQELQRLVQMVMHTHHQVSQIPSADSKFDVSEQFNPSPSIAPPLAALKPTPLKTATPKTAVKPTAQSLSTPAASSLQPNRRMIPVPSASMSPTTDREEWVTGTHQPMAQRLFQQGSTMAQELRGWRLALVISLIILSAFGAGFLIVRPLMNQPAPRR